MDREREREREREGGRDKLIEKRINYQDRKMNG